MLTIEQIEQGYEEKLRPFRRNILREYLQYKILDIIFNSEFSNRLIFMGGTALRIVYGNTRFSEDLDFDNLGLSEKEFKELSLLVKKGLELEGYVVEVDNVFKGAYRCIVKLPEVLFNNKLSVIKEEKIMIQIDTVAQKFEYIPERKIINKFDVFTEIKVVPLSILLSQKFFAVFNRKRDKGRDFYDILFLLQLIKPDYAYLKDKLGISNESELKEKILLKIDRSNLEDLSKDVEPFLFNPSDSKKILLFGDYIKQIDL
jgi:predicted nucleotidyltransferase component of viral defense system